MYCYLLLYIINLLSKKRKKGKELKDIDNSMIAGGGEGRRGYEGIKGDGKIKKKKKYVSSLFLFGIDISVEFVHLSSSGVCG